MNNCRWYIDYPCHMWHNIRKAYGNHEGEIHTPLEARSRCRHSVYQVSENYT